MKTSNRSGHYYNKRLIFSDAYQELTLSARDLLFMMITELRYSNKKRRDGVDKQWTNNGEVSVTQSQFRKQLGYCRETYLKARDQLIKVGFIKQTHRGGKGAGDRAKYEVLISANGIEAHNERWTEYPKKDWIDEIPEAKNQLIGTKTRWKKGKSGRKL